MVNTKSSQGSVDLDYECPTCGTSVNLEATKCPRCTTLFEKSDENSATHSAPPALKTGADAQPQETLEDMLNTERYLAYLRISGTEKQVLKALDRATKLRPWDATAWLDKGYFLALSGKSREAIDAYNRVSELRPGSAIAASAWNYKGVLFSRLNRPKEELEAFITATKLNPDFAGAWSNKGATLYRLGRLEEALKAYTKAAELPSSSTRTQHHAQHYKGDVLAELGRFEEASAVYDKLIKSDPSDGLAWACKSIVLRELGESEEALHARDKAIELDPRYKKINESTTVHNLNWEKTEGSGHTRPSHDVSLLSRVYEGLRGALARLSYRPQ